jgi:hypothetical protein
MYKINVMFTAQLTQYIYTTYQQDYYGEENNGEAPKNLGH